jgi:hypothetical protein
MLKENENKFQKKNPENFWESLDAPKLIFETFLHSRTTRRIGMNATHTTFYLIQKIKQGLFSILYFL